MGLKFALPAHAHILRSILISFEIGVTIQNQFVIWECAVCAVGKLLSELLSHSGKV